MGAYHRYNIITSGHHVRNVWMCCVKCFLNDSNKRWRIVHEMFKRVLQNKEEVHESWKKNLSVTIRLGSGRLMH
jgi:hypothetical protein